MMMMTKSEVVIVVVREISSIILMQVLLPFPSFFFVSIVPFFYVYVITGARRLHALVPNYTRFFSSSWRQRSLAILCNL